MCLFHRKSTVRENSARTKAESCVLVHLKLLTEKAVATICGKFNLQKEDLLFFPCKLVSCVTFMPYSKVLVLVWKKRLQDLLYGLVQAQGAVISLREEIRVSVYFQNHPRVCSSSFSSRQPAKVRSILHAAQNWLLSQGHTTSPQGFCDCASCRLQTSNGQHSP